MHELHCLGQATLRSPRGRLIHFRSRKHLALLIYLALNAERAHRRERLAGLLWSDSDDSKARHSLSQALYAIRRLLGGAVRIEGEDLELTLDSLRVDALEMEWSMASADAAAAADLYRGDFLEGFWVRGAQGFEEWAGRERARFAALAREALRQAIEAARDRCDWPQVKERAERLVVLDAFDEAAYAELMRALWMIGDRAAALDRYDQLKRVLATELQSTPSRETAALAERIRQRPVRGGWTSQRLLRESDHSVFQDPPFVGRKSELTALAAEWSRVATGETRTVALVGGAGIGKTRLAEEFLKSLELNDVTILRSRCYEAEQSLPYGPVAEALRQGIDLMDLSDVDPLWLAELARIVPEARGRYGKLPEPAQLDAEGGRRRLYEGIARVLRAACETRPVLLFVDDLHWADDSSLALLHYLHRRVTNGLYLLSAHRPEELAARDSAVTAELLSGRNPQVRTIRLAGLDCKESSELLAALIGDDQDTAALDSVRLMTGGNPLFAVELARSLAEEQTDAYARPPVPHSIRALFDRRFAALSDRAVALMQQAAVLGSRSSYQTLSAAAGIPPIEVDATIRELTRAAILSEEDELVSFRHDLIREVAVAQVPTGLARALHLKAARALIETAGDPGEIAVHLSAAGDTAKAFEYALRGTEAAEQLFALEEAADLLQLAIEHAPNESERMSLVGRLGKLFLHMREYAKARPLLRERQQEVEKGSYRELERFEATRDLLILDVYSSTLSLDRSAEALRELHSQLVESSVDAPRLEADILRSLLWAAARAFNPSLVEETIGKIKELHDRATQPDVRCRTARSLGIYHSYKGSSPQAKSLLQQSLKYAQEAGDEAALVDAYVGMSTFLHRMPDMRLADHILQVALPLAEHNADPAQISALLCNLAVYHMYLRNTESAEELLVNAKQLLESTGYHPDTLPSVLFDLGFVAYLRGDFNRAERCWTDSLKIGEQHGVLPVVLESLASLGLVKLHRDDIVRARQLAARALRLARRGGFLLDQRCGLEELLARLRFRSGKRAKALRGLADAAACAREADIPSYLAAQVTRLDLLINAGRSDEATEVYKQLSNVAQTYGMLRWIAVAERICSRP